MSPRHRGMPRCPSHPGPSRLHLITHSILREPKDTGIGSGVDRTRCSVDRTRCSVDRTMVQSGSHQGALWIAPQIRVNRTRVPCRSSSEPKGSHAGSMRIDHPYRTRRKGVLIRSHELRTSPPRDTGLLAARCSPLSSRLRSTPLAEGSLPPGRACASWSGLFAKRIIS
jgi:hypothetical protein